MDGTESPHIKEEPEELWSHQEEGKLQGPEEAEIIQFTFFPDLVKSEDDAEKPWSPHLYQKQTEEKETEPDRKDSGGAEAACYLDPERNLQPDIEVNTEDFSEAETDDSEDWRETTEQQLGLNFKGNITNKRKRTDKKSHHCSECGKCFYLKGNLTDHMRIHTGEKPFSCSECGKTFSLKGNLKRHMRSHTGEKPFSCSECGKRFTQQGSVITHMRIHMEEKPFSCSECGRRFTQQGSMISHMRIHSLEKRFGCSECGKRFHQKRCLSRHMIVHTGEKLFSCCECGKRFSRQESMTRHMVVHTRETTLTC
ncbi:gastrula zinc finger protein XlCGF7.1-like [Cheilinus undulatus]|uniref:gastrula zinc finger protein XlCGF7.1-like n=1 Tax=Cheilinus undulatus TaxID=241271 RepID=UPI001BD64518|nr:gastrula zinc finger protein XlCGF7.1-like [Cheilinus undulatus]